MTLDELKKLLRSGTVIRCENSDQKQDVIHEMIGMGFSCSQTMRESVNMGFPFVGLTGTHVDGFMADYVDKHDIKYIPAEEALGAGGTAFVVMNVAYLLI
jgi:hypothetical protein